VSLVGARIGAYEIAAKLGEGGMGEVFRARDTRLGRDVALKVLPASVASDADRLARFEREARALAALNHPGIGSIYGFEDGVTDRGTRIHAIVMELVPGQTLAERVTGGPIPVAEAVSIARQLADALDAAHGQGIVHRDLKPANIKLRPDGMLKVLDFGLARAVETSTAAADSALMTAPGMRTEAGVILGTAAYMSPEQARGLAVDKRTDIWSFGCVLFEMLTGRIAFAGSTASDSIAAILGRDPDWSSLPPGTPGGVRRLLRCCLEKDARQRLRDLGDVDLALDVTAPTVGPAASAGADRRLPWVIAAIAAAAAIGLAVVSLARAPRAPERATPVRFDIDTGVRLADSGGFSVSPDGRHIAFAGVGGDGKLRLWARSLESLEARPLQGTEAEFGQVIPAIFWSPDSRFIGFVGGGVVKTVERTGGVPQIVCRTPGIAVGGTWNRRGVILVGNTAGAVLQCPASGGTAAPVTAVDAGDKGLGHLMPQFLPDDRRFIYLRVSRQRPSETGLFLGDLDLPPERQRSDRLLATGFTGAYIADTPTSGRILYIRDGTLMALPVDAALNPVADAAVVAASVGTFLDGALFSVANDVIVYRGANPEYQLTWKDRHGADIGTLGEPAAYASFDLSRDAARVVAGRNNQLNRADRDLWLLDVARNATTRLTSDAMLEGMSAWSADGSEVFYPAGMSDSDVRRLSWTGGRDADVVLPAGSPNFRLNSQTTTLSTSADGRFLVYAAEGDTTGSDIWVLPLNPLATPQPFIREAADQADGRVSPDGRWIAYTSTETGASEVFLRRLLSDGSATLPKLGVVIPVSSGGGFAPRWRADANELFYQSASGKVMAVSVTGDEIGKPAELFAAPRTLRTWGVAPDGQRFLMAVPTRQAAPSFTVVLNWRSSLKP
jgi:Tol biopolymer transport system component